MVRCSRSRRCRGTLDGRARIPSASGRIRFSESLVLADRRDERRVWVLHAFGSLLYQYGIDGDAGSVQTLEFLDLEGFDKGAFAALKDGSFLYTAGNQLIRFFPGGKRTKLALPEGASVWRLLTTRASSDLDRACDASSISSDPAAGARVARLLELRMFRRRQQRPGARSPSRRVTARRDWSLVVYDASGSGASKQRCCPTRR
jgi:hypothetical protein